MARPKSSKVYIRSGRHLYALMWAKIAGDGSVMLGFPFDGKEDIELILDEELGELRPNAIITREAICRPKINFHASGQYKLTVQIGKDSKAIDRATVQGPKLEDISEPRRMAEMLLPRMLPKADEQPTDLDIVLDATGCPDMPLRCTISCMSKEVFPKILERGGRIVDTSVWECVHALENATHAWVWTLRASRNDEVYVNRVLVFLIGPIKWGNEPSNKELQATR